MVVGDAGDIGGIAERIYDKTMVEGQNSMTYVIIAVALALGFLIGWFTGFSAGMSEVRDGR